MYICACNKTAATYELIFQKILELEPDFQPAHITFDFEQAAIKAARNNFPNALVHACNFHYGQSIWRKIQQIGLQVPYSNDTQFAFNIRLLLALPFVPVDDVVMAFEELTTREFYSETESDHSLAIQELLNYFESTYIGKFDRRGQRKAGFFPIELWNVYALVLEGI